MTVLVLGSVNADLVVAVHKRPGAGETVLGSDTRVLPGGKGANTAVAAARFGGAVALIGAVGGDRYGDLLLDALTDACVDTARVRRVDRPTGIAYITVTPDGENSIVVSPGANHALTDADVDLGGATVLVASLEVPIGVVEHAVAEAVTAKIRPVLNLSPVSALSHEALVALDPLVVNEHEAAELAGEPAGLLGLGVRSAVVTLGGRGAIVLTGDGITEVPAPSVEPVDTTGAGDGFIGALAARLAEGDDLVTATRQAVAFAAISVTRPGAQPSYPTAAEVALANNAANSRP